MKLRLRDGLPIATASVRLRGSSLELDRVLVDTGSLGTIIAVDRTLVIGLEYEPEDPVRRIRGVGGTEFVYTKQVDCLQVAGLGVEGFTVELGAMDYGYALDAIVGMDFLRRVRAIIDLGKLTIGR